LNETGINLKFDGDLKCGFFKSQFNSLWAITR